MQPYGRRKAVRFPGKRQWNIKHKGRKLKSWWEGDEMGEHDKRRGRREFKDIDDEIYPEEES